MPTVRKGARQVSTMALPGARLTAAETPESRGAGLQQAKAGTADALGRLGGTVGELAFRQYAKQEAEARDHANKVKRLSWQNQFSEWNQTRIFDPQTGALQQQGKNAFGLPEKLDADFQKFADGIKLGLANDDQKLAFDADRQQFENTWKINVERHVGEQIAHQEATEFQSVLKNSLNEATVSAHDPRLVRDALQRGLDAIQTHGPTLGMGRQAQATAKAAFTSGLHVAVIENLLANGEDRRAQIYFEETKGAITDAEALTAITAKLDVASTEAAGTRGADAIWKTQGPKGDEAPVNLDVMSDQARTQFENDPKTLKVVLQSLRERATEHNAAQQERRASNESEVWKAYNGGAKLDDLRKMPQYLALPGATQATIRQHVVDRAYELGQRARGLTRQDLEDQRVSDAATERKTWASYWQYSDPVALSKMSDAQVLNLTPEIGVEHVNRLMTQRRTLTKSEDAVRTATIDDELFKSIAAGAGLRPYQAQQSEADKATLGQLKNRVETAIDAEQQRHGRPLTRDEKQGLMHSIVDQRVMLDWTFGDQSASAATVVNPKDQAVAYVPWAQIKPVNQQEWIRVVRSNFPSAQRQSDAEILTRYQSRIQRAHAAVVLGLGDAEALRRLQGGD